MKDFTLFRVVAVCSAIVGLGSDAAAQDTRGFVGEHARVWVDGSERPVSGRITHATGTFLRLSTENRICTDEGCANSFSAGWPSIDRMQINHRSRSERLIRASLIAGAAGAVLVQGIRMCSKKDDRDAIDSCRSNVVGLTVGIGVAGFFVSRPRWRDVPLP